MGSAVQRAFLKINDAVLDGGETLDSFAEVAGMSSSEFQTAWGEDAAYALIPFLEGLHETHEAGGNVNQILRDLGITSVNELNTLLVLAGGYESLAGNLELASNAYNETEESMMALNKEAELAYGTTLGKLRTAWNRLKDSLIDIGEPIADAVLDMVDAADPLFETIENIATGFSEMDESAQRDIINTVGKIALIAPALKIAGGAMTTTGDLFKVGAGVTRKAGEIITKAMFGVAGEAETLTTVAGTAAGSQGVGGLVGVLSGAGAGALPWALGIAAVALGGWTLWKTWGEDAFEAAKRTKEWGFAISEETANATNDFLELSEKASIATSEMGVNVESGATKAANAYETMATEILNSVNGNIAEAQEVLGMFSDEMVDIVGGSYERYIEKQENLRTRTEEIQSEITAIYENATRENREFTDEEISIIEGYHTRLAELRSKSLDLSADEQRKVMAVMKNDLEQFSDEQLKSRERYLRDEQGLAKESYQIQKESLDEQLTTGQLTKQRHQEAMKQLDEEAKADAILVASELLKVWEAQGVDAQDIKNRLAIMATETGFTYEEVAKKARESAMGVTDSTGIMAKELDNMTEDTKQANEAWNSMVLDPVTGEVHTNVEDVLKEIATADNGWEELDFILKNANLDTNAKQVLFQALASNKEWWEMEYPIKNADLKTNAAGIAKQFLIAYGQWEGLDPKVHSAILETNTPEQLEQVLKDHGVWENLNPREWDLLFQNNAPQTSSDIKAIHTEWKGTEFERKNINVTTNAWATADSAQRAINSVKGRSVTVHTSYTSAYATAAERGLNFHTGGTALVNDQQGATFRELVTLPDGSSFIPSGRNVLLDLPKGSKVLRAALTKMKFPDIKQYQDGVGYSRQQTQQIVNGNSVDMSQTNSLLQTLVELIRNGQVIVMDGNEVGRTVYPTIDSTMNNSMQRNKIMNMQGG